MEIVKIYNAQNKMMAEQIKSLLLDSEIQSTYSEVGSGQVLNVSQGMSPFGVDILVKEEDAEKATDIIQTFFGENSNIDDEDEIDDKPRFRDNKFAIRIFIIIFLLFMLGIYIFSLFI